MLIRHTEDEDNLKYIIYVIRYSLFNKRKDIN